jgi:hypothetical protein
MRRRQDRHTVQDRVWVGNVLEAEIVAQCFEVELAPEPGMTISAFSSDAKYS